MSLTDFFKDVGDDVAKGLNATSNFLNKDPIQGFLRRDVVKPAANVISPSLERVSQGLTWLYDNGISQPISTALMAGTLKGGPFSAHNWAVAWHAANHISPGQALFLNQDQTTKAVNSPLEYYKPGAAYLPPGFEQLPEAQQQQILKQAGMPAVGNAYINELRHANSTYKNATGVADFALTWYGDPLVLGGKILSKERALRTVVTRPQATRGVFGLGKAEGGFEKADIDKIMNNSVVTKVIDTIMKNRDNPQLLNNLPFAKDSALGPRFGPIASKLQTYDEAHDFVRVTLGDIDAIERLQTKNALAASRIAQDTDRFGALGLMHTRYANLGDGRMTAMIDQQMRELNGRINADGDLVRRYNQVLDHAHELDRVNLTRWQFAKAQAATTNQIDYRSGVARGIKAQKLISDESGMRRVSVRPTPPIFKAGTSTPVDLGLVKNRIYGAGDFFSSPVTLVRSLNNARPNGYMRLDDLDKDSIAELRGQIARIPGLSSQTRLKMLNDYLKTTDENDRLAMLKTIGATGAAKVAEKHGLDPKAGLEIYQEHLKRQFKEIDNMKRYSAASKPVELPDGSFARVKVDEFADDGGKVVIHPNMVTRLANDHVFQDLDEMDKVLARHASPLKALRTNALGNTDWMVTGADYLSSMWKFGTLFRLGYIPRVASDDLAGQVARLGAATMALRAGWGIRNGATNVAMRVVGRPMAAARAATAQQGVNYADDAIRELEAQMAPLRDSIALRRSVVQSDLTKAGRRLTAAQAKRAAMGPGTPAAKTAAMDQLIAKHQTAVAKASRSMSTGVKARTMKLRDLESQHGFLSRYRDLQQRVVDDATATVNAPKAMQGAKTVALPGGVEGPAAFAGENGQYFYKQISSDEILGQLFLTNKQLIHGHLMRSFDNGAKAISANTESEALHATSWAHAINAQLMQDPLARQAVRGASVDDMVKWLKSTAEGRDYQRRLGVGANGAISNPEELANSIWHDVAEYMPTPEIRDAALRGELTPQFLKDNVPMAARPDVHTGQVGQAAVRYYRAMDKVMAGWYKYAATMPADRLSRHPLFNQLYEGHMKTIAGQLKKQGAYDTTVEGVEQMAATARRLALKDTRRLVFDIAHRSDAAAALRFISPFFAATAESFQRWARIIADKPQVVGYANNFYNSGMGLGQMQDADGNHITKDGHAYTIDPKTGKAVKTLVPKSQRYIVGRMPKWLIHTTGGKLSPFALAFGIEPASRDFKLSQNSMDLVTQGDPWFNPGMGPIVQIPVNALVKDKPRQAELARKLQILPFGPQNGGPFGSGPVGEAASFLMPSAVKNFLTAYDTSDARYQAVKLQIMQRAAYEHAELGKPMPSPSQIAKMTKQYWEFSAASAFLQPMATQKRDKYQFYRDQYNALQRANPLTADDEFLKRFGESYFIFAQSQSKNESGVPATVKAVELEKKYGNLIAQNPELGALIVGPEGDGPFSPEAYSYQLNTPVTPGGAEMQRTKMSADEAMQDNQRRKGWSDFTKLMNALGAQLRNAGFKSYSDKGAEQFKALKSQIVQALGSPTLPDGQVNPYYNEQWSKDFNTLDSLKYERLIPSLTQVAHSDLAQDPNRSDLRTLQNYLAVRKYVTDQLAARKKAGGSNVITARSNADLLAGWQSIVDGMIESDTRFGDLHSRYLSRDLGYSDITNEELAV